MSKSLSDQLVGLGLADKAKAKQTAHEKRVKKTKKKKAKDTSPTTEALTAEAHAKAMAEKAEKDKALEAERRAVRERAEKLAQARDLVRSNGKPVTGEDKKYRFTFDKKIKELWVTSADFERLASGKIGIAQVDKRWFFVEPPALARIQERAPDLISFLAKPEEVDPDDPYADFQIPDDLDW